MDFELTSEQEMWRALRVMRVLAGAEPDGELGEFSMGGELLQKDQIGHTIRHN
jgi:hypothetical protein